MSENLKTVATDIKEFSDFIVNNCYYVDKTQYIKTIMKDGSATMLFTRPRRFGKSITLSMLKSFLEINYEDPSDKSKQIELFKDTEIFKDKEFCDEYMGQYPVIFLSLKDAWSKESSEIAINKFFDELGKVAEEFQFLLVSDKLDANLKKNLQELIDLKDRKIPYTQKWITGTSFLSDLMSILKAATSKDVVVLIDEYDVPLSKVANCDFYQKIRDITSILFSSGLKNNKLLKKSVITGCLRVAKESIFTGLNNFYSCGLDNYDYSKLFGFTTDEVKTMLSYYGLDDRYAEYQKWYDGYHIGDDDIFCPWDVISRTKAILVSPKLGPESYWGGTGNIELVSKMFASDPDTYADDLQSLLDGKSITVKVSRDINYEILGKSKNSNYFWNFFFSSGYLTYAKNLKHEEQVADEVNSNTQKTVSLVIPNLSVREELGDAISWCFTKANPKFNETLPDLLFALKQTDPGCLEEYLQDTLATYVSIYDTQKGTDKESMYHAFLNGRLSALLNKGDNKYASNAELGDGRADFSFLLKLDAKQTAQKTGFIIEIKAAKSDKQMMTLAKDAIKQVKEKHYAKSLFRFYKRIKEIRVFGIAFYKKTCWVEFESIQKQD